MGTGKMVTKYRVTALNMGTLMPGQALLADAAGYQRKTPSPVWSAAIEGDGHRIIVDTGIADLEWVCQNVSLCTRETDETIDAAVRQIGWDPQSVDTIINTHLHYDHCGGNELFPDAHFYVSAKEWEHAAAPIITQMIYYDQAWLRGELHYVPCQFATDQLEILPGINLLLTPGHTPGHLSVLVDTDEGILAIGGDALGRREGIPFWGPPRILHDASAAQASVERIRSVADRVLSGHDSDISKYQDHLFPKIK
jgi:N-acyl homoserine lactone hydrolase